VAQVKRTARERNADEKLRLITPLLVPGQDKGQLIHAMKEIELREGVSYRTLGRYLRVWETDGYEGLKPKPPWNSGKTQVRDLPAAIREAIALRKECPERSVKDIISILEMEGKIQPGSIRRQTLQRHLQGAGYSAKQARANVKTGSRAARRFQKAHRCELWQSDIKYGPYLPIGEGGKMCQVYLCVFLDDCSRFVVSAAFGEKMDGTLVEECFRQAVMRYGKPDVLYVDNGAQYITQWLARACHTLGTVLLHTKPYDPEAKGKVEAFNHRVNAFLSETALERPRTLEALNRHLEAWISEYYHKNGHRSLGGVPPLAAFGMDTRPLSFVDADTVREAFLHVEERQADKTGCVSFSGKTFEAGMAYAGKKVEVVYDPAYLEEIEVRDMDGVSVRAHAVQAGSFCGAKKTAPPDEASAADGSRMLKALNKRNITHRSRAAVATSFRAVHPSPEADDHV
jgi:transposase InsO family protein